MNIEAFYRKHGVFRNGDFQSPPLNKKIGFKLPKNSVILFPYKGMNGSVGYFEEYKDKKGFIETNLVSEDMKGVKGKKTIDVGRLISSRMKEDRTLQYLPSLRLVSSVKRDALLGVDFSSLEDIYKYTSVNKAKDYKKENLLETIAKYVSEERYGMRNYFLSMRIPSKFPSYDLMLKMFDNFYKYSNSSDLFMWLELFKMLHKDYSETSAFRHLEGKSLYLLIEGEKEVITIATPILLASSKDSGYPRKLITGHGFKEAWQNIIKMVMLVPVYLDESSEPIVVKSVKDINLDTTLVEKMEVNDVVDVVITNEIKDIEPSSELERGLNQFKDSGVMKDDFTKKHKLLIQENIDKLKALEDRDLSFKVNKIPKGINILDDSLSTDTVNAMHKTYMREHYDKDIEMAIRSLSNGGVLIKDVEIKHERDIGNAVSTAKVKILLPNGTTNVLTIILPTPDKDGVFLNSGNEYILDKQRGDTVIKKISPTSVSLMTYYGKLFVNKASNSRFNKSKSILNSIQNLVNDENSPITMVNTGTQKLDNLILPNLYGVLIREMSGMQKGDEFYDFKYQYHLANLEKAGLNKNSKDVIIGKCPKGYILMNQRNEIYYLKSGKASTPMSFLTHIGIDELEIPLEYAEVKILGVRTPVVLILSRWKGLTKTLKNVKHRFVASKKDIMPDEHSITFADGFLVFGKGDIQAELLLGGLKPLEKHTKFLNIVELDSVDGIKDLLHTLGNVTRLDGEIRTIQTMFIDPMAKRALKNMEEPTKMYELILRCLDILLTDNFKDPFSTDTFLMKGHERVAGMLYNTLSTAFRVYSKKSGLMKAKMVVNPYETYSNISSDQTFALIEDQNPMEAQKQTLEVKSTGMFGRGKESITAKDRAYNINDVGIYSEGGKDDGNVGSTIFATDNANVVNVQGKIEVLEDKDLTPGNTFSPTMLLTPAGNEDDGKRALYSTIMEKHVVAILNSYVLPFRTGYESMLPYKVSDKFAINATKVGKVKKITKDSIHISYKDGEEKYSLQFTSNRIIGGKHYRFETKTLLSVGDKVEIGDNITYNSSFFAQDMLNQKRVAYKGGRLATVALDGGHDSYEDSSMVWEGLSKDLASPVMETKGEIVDCRVNVINVVKVGDEVDIGDSLMTYVHGDIESFGKGMDNLNEMNSTSFKSESKGIVRDVKIYYFADPSEISETLKKIIAISDSKLKSKTGYTGAIKLGFSKDGKQLAAGEVLVMVSVEKVLELGINDKYIIGAQLKTTVGKIFKSITTKLGERIDIKFNSASITARIVNGPFIQGLMNRILNKMEKDIIDMGLD